MKSSHNVPDTHHSNVLSQRQVCHYLFLSGLWSLRLTGEPFLEVAYPSLNHHGTKTNTEKVSCVGFCTPECASQSHHFDCREEQGRAREAGGKENWKRKIWQDLNFPGGSDGNKSVCKNAGDPGSIPGLGRSPGRENDNPLQYSCLENSMDRGAWRDTVHRVSELDTTEWLALSLFHP